MKTLLWMILVILVSSCSKEEPPRVPSTNALTEAPFDLSRLDKQRVKELLVVVFDHDYTVNEWKVIFDQTQTLSTNRRKLRLIEGRMDLDAEAIRGEMIAQNAELLSALGDQSLFIMSWSANDENCRFDLGFELKLGCRPKSRDNPLNGGLPVPVGAVNWIQPNPVVDTAKTAYLRYFLKRESQPSYQLELRLRPESLGADELWFKGEAIPAPESRFQAMDGSERPARFPYGYAEMTLAH